MKVSVLFAPLPQPQLTSLGTP